MDVVDTSGESSLLARSMHIELCPVVQTSVLWPYPIDQRLNELAVIASTIAGDVSRSQLLAAIVSNTAADREHLRSVLAHYKGLTVGRVVLQRTGEVVVSRRPAGRRPRRSNG